MEFYLKAIILTYFIGLKGEKNIVGETDEFTISS